MKLSVFLTIYFFLDAPPAAPDAPVVSCSASENRIKFKCKIFRNNHTDVYEVTWFQSAYTAVSKEIYTEELEKENESYLQNTYNNTLYHLGSNVSFQLLY